MIKKLTISGLLIISIILLCYDAYLFWLEVSGKAWLRRNQDFIIKAEQLRGRKESEVVKVFGIPKFTIDAEQVRQGTVQYPIEGYAKPDKKISNKVLVYIKGDAIFYFYINHHGIVEDIFYGPS